MAVTVYRIIFGKKLVLHLLRFLPYKTKAHNSQKEQNLAKIILKNLVIVELFAFSTYFVAKWQVVHQFLRDQYIFQMRFSITTEK